MSFDPKKTNTQSNIAEIEYFYYSRDRLDGQFPTLHAELHQQTTKEYCILLAARLAEYPITWTNYMPTLTMLLADQLRQVLEQDDILSTWSDHLDILSWILFVATVAPITREKRSWLMNALDRVIAVKYGYRGKIKSKLDAEWRDIEWNNARTFVWSDTHMRSGFDKVCVELEAVRYTEVITKVEDVAQQVESSALW